RERFQTVPATGHERDRGAFFGEPAGGGGPDAAACTGDKGRGAGQFRRHGVLSPLLVYGVAVRGGAWPSLRQACRKASSCVSDADRSRWASICARRSRAFCSAVGSASAPATHRSGGCPESTRVTSAFASLAGSFDCRPLMACHAGLVCAVRLA